MSRYAYITWCWCAIALIVVIASQEPLLCASKRIEPQPHIISLFPPDDDAVGYLTQLIDAEKRRICVAAYRLTQEDVVAHLHSAYSRGVDVQVIADASALEARNNYVLKMLRDGISVYVFPPLSPEDTADDVRISRAALMHNKFMVFEQSNTVWTGSFNFTQAAQKMNQENVIVMRDTHQCNRYKEHFELIKRRSTMLTHMMRKALRK